MTLATTASAIRRAARGFLHSFIASSNTIPTLGIQAKAALKIDLMTLSVASSVETTVKMLSAAWPVSLARYYMRLATRCAVRFAPFQRFTTLACVLTAAAIAAAPMTLSAQRDTNRGAPSGRGSIGIHLQLSEPTGDFGRNSGNGFGVGAYVLTRVDRHALLHWRVDASLLTYGNSLRRIPLAGTGGLVQLNLRTSNNIVSLVTGPQLLGPTGLFTPYATALGGFSVFWTSSSVEGTANQREPFATTTNSSDAEWAYGGAVGSYIRVTQGRTPVRIDLGARLLRHDDVRYLNDDRVREAYNNDRPPVPLRGRADFITYYLGANVIAF